MTHYRNVIIVLKNNSSNSEEKTELLGGSNNDQTIDVATDKTQVFGGGIFLFKFKIKQ